MNDIVEIIANEPDEIVLLDDDGQEEVVIGSESIVILGGGGGSGSVAQSDVVGLVPRLDGIDASLVLKATQAALDALTVIVDSKATTQDVNQALADLLATDTQVLQTLQQLSQALVEYEDLLEALEYTVANRVRFDTNNQGLTSLQKANARTNIGAEEVGTAAALIALLPPVEGYHYSYVDKTIRQAGVSVNSTLDVFGSGAVFSAGQLQLDDVIEIEVWIKTTGSATGNIQMLLSANGSAAVNTLNLSLASDSRTRLTKYKATIIVDWQTVSGAVLPVLYISNDGTTRGTFVDQSIALSAFGESQALSLAFTLNVSSGMTAGAELAIRKAQLRVTRN